MAQLMHPKQGDRLKVACLIEGKLFNTDRFFYSHKENVHDSYPVIKYHINQYFSHNPSCDTIATIFHANFKQKYIILSNCSCLKANWSKVGVYSFQQYTTAGRFLTLSLGHVRINGFGSGYRGMLKSSILQSCQCNQHP